MPLLLLYADLSHDNLPYGSSCPRFNRLATSNRHLFRRYELLEVYRRCDDVMRIVGSQTFGQHVANLQPQEPLELPPCDYPSTFASRAE